MTNAPSPKGCAQFETLAPELALGALAGNDRSAILVHLETCSHCRQLVEDFAAVADDLLLLAPEGEPPLGFESRAAARITAAADAVAVGTAGSMARASGPVGVGGAAAGSGGRSGVRSGSRRRRVQAVAAAAFVAGAVAAGGISLLVSSREGPITPSGPVVRIAAVNANGGAYTCHAVAVGSKPTWLYLSVDQPGQRDGQYHVEAVTSSGGRATWPVGTVVVTNGHGTLAVPLDLVAADLRSLRILDAGGQVRYEAPFTSTGGARSPTTSIA